MTDIGSQQVADIKLSIAIAHVPDDAGRRAMLLQIQKALAPHKDLLASLTTVRDTQRKGLWPTARQCWISYSPKATHHLVLYDDMLPCRDFVPALLQALKERPEHCINLFSMRKIIDEVRERGDSWHVSREGAWGGTTILPVQWIKPFLEWCRLHIADSYKWDDRRMVLWLYHHGHLVWQTVPCLLEHIGAAQSLLGNSNSKRIATWFLGQQQSALEIDWSKGIEDPLRDMKPIPDAHIYQEALPR